MVRIGTSYEDLLAECGGLMGDKEKVVLNGGPMMGISQMSLRRAGGQGHERNNGAHRGYGKARGVPELYQVRELHRRLSNGAHAP